MVSVKSTEVNIGAPPCADAPFVCLAGCFSTGAAGAGPLPLGASGLMALLEMTNRRRTGAVVALAGLALRWLLRDALFGVVTLRFNIKYLTCFNGLSSEKKHLQTRIVAS